jgi:hypothetical protein
LKRKYKIGLLVLLLIYPVYKGVRELCWVKHTSYTIGHSLKIKLRIDNGIVGLQDHENDKTITITNSKTKAVLTVSYVSLEPNLYFYLDTIHSRKLLSIADQFAGQNTYDYSTLKLISSKDCFKTFGGCGGFNDSCLSALGKPDLVFDDKGLHK